MSFVAELRRRNVIRMAGLYLVGAWLITQVAATLLPGFEAPPWVFRVIVMLLAIGFLPALVFSWVYEITPEGLKRESEIERHESITPETGQRMNRAIVALLVLAVGIFAIDRFVLAPRRAAAAVPSAKVEPVAEAAVSENSIAVLPLANGSGDKDQQYFSDGLSEGLIIALSRLDGLKVIGRNSSFQFRDSKEDSKSIAGKLGVATVLEGSVQRAGEMVRISASLIRAADRSTLWVEQYDRPYKDLFALQDEITKAVATALKARLLAGSATPVQVDRPPSGSLEAYNALLQGRFYSARGTDADMRGTIEQFGKATRLDPGYALAWSELSRAWSELAAMTLSGAEAQQSYAQARTAADRALALDPNLADAYGARGYFLTSADFDWAGAEAAYRRAQQLAPNDGRTKYELGRIAATLGRVDEAAALTRTALTIDPLNARWHIWLAVYLMASGQPEQARPELSKSIELQPLSLGSHFYLAMSEILSGNAAAALAAAEAEPPGAWHDFAVGMAKQVGSDRVAADAALKAVIDQYSELGAFQIAEIYAVRKDGDKVFEWLERAWSVRDPGVQGMRLDPLLLAFRDDPRFAAFCSKVGLPAPTGAKAGKA